MKITKIKLDLILIKKKSGYTLIEILVSLGLSFLLAAAVAVAFSNFVSGNRQNKIRLARQTLLLEIKNQIIKPALLKHSSLQTGNEQLLKCVSNSSSTFNSTECWAMTTQSPQPLVLYDFGSTNKISEGDLSNVNIGIRYTVEGTKCPTGANASTCPIIVRTFFRPVCRVEGYSLGTYTYTKQQRCTNSIAPTNPNMAAVASNKIYDIQIHYHISADMPAGSKFPFKSLSTLPNTITTYGSNSVPLNPIIVSAIRIDDPTKY